MPKGRARDKLLADLLSSYEGEYQLESAVLHGEDHCRATGQRDYLRRFGNELSIAFFAVNVDEVGYYKGGTSFSFYECSRATAERAMNIFRDNNDLIEGPQWFNGDHMIFAQAGVPYIAMTAENMPELMKRITHTQKDTPDIVDPTKLVMIAQALNELVRSD